VADTLSSSLALSALMLSRGSKRKPAANSIAAISRMVKTTLTASFASSEKNRLLLVALTSCQSEMR
jgi:hypothetical protein